MTLQSSVRLVEVGPRDGLQNEARALPVETRIALIELLAEAGMPAVEAGSFVSPRWVPSMAGTAEVLAGIRRRPGTRYPVLVPNARGLADALAAGADEVAVFAAASETFSRRNVNAGIEEVLARSAAVAEGAREHGLPVRGYVSCALGCPYEREIAPAAVAEVAARLHALGCYEVSLGDTIGVGTPARARDMVRAVAERVPLEALAAHFHDTYGQALANLLAVLELGLGTVDCAVAGLGGCPYAPGAAGNVASEDVVYMLDGLGVRTGVDLEALAEAGRFATEALGRRPASRVAQALAAGRLRAAPS
jgi:hydroxymethylglutaryl-CoA lyase